MRHIPIHFLMLFLTLAINQTVLANEPDSVYLFSYATVKDKGHSGLQCPGLAGVRTF
jgi:hypothetical protein